MGFVDVVPPVVGGTVLIIERIQSQNYSPGVAGWALWADGTADLQSALVRGEVIVGDPAGQRVEISTQYSGAPEIDLWTGNPDQDVPGRIEMGGVSSPVYMQLESGHDSGSVSGFPARIILNSNAAVIDPVYGNSIEIQSDLITVTTPILLDTVWTTIPLAGTWGDLAGARVGYFKDSTGRVQLRGVVIGGAGPGIGNMPAGYRPTQSMEWIMRGQGGVILCAVTVSTAGVITASANPVTAQANGVRLDSISYPTL